MAELSWILRGLTHTHYSSFPLRRHFSLCHCNSAKLGVFLHKLLDKSKKRHPQQYVYMPPNSSVPSAPRKVQERTRRQRVLNAVLMESLSNIMVTGDLSEKLKGCAVELTQVRISADCTHLNVYWVTSIQEHGAHEKVAELLQSSAGYLKSELIKNGFMGKAPKITFVKDVTYGRAAAVEKLIDKVSAEVPPDLGLPGTENVEEPDDGGPGESANASSAGSVRARPYVPPDMRMDAYGLDHAALMRQVLLKSKGLHRAPLEELAPLRPGSQHSEDAEARLLSLAEYVRQRKLKSRQQTVAEREARRSLISAGAHRDAEEPLPDVATPGGDDDIDEVEEELSAVSFLEQVQNERK